jgi:hypothetical protein
VLGTKTQIKRKRQKSARQNKDVFIALIEDIEKAYIRQQLLIREFAIDNTDYDELFFTSIDTLIFLKYGKDCTALINFYLYERFNDDGSINELHDENQNVIILKTAEDLWNLVVSINPSLAK